MCTMQYERRGRAFTTLSLYKEVVQFTVYQDVREHPSRCIKNTFKRTYHPVASEVSCHRCFAPYKHAHTLAQTFCGGYYFDNLFPPRDLTADPTQVRFIKIKGSPLVRLLKS